MAGFVEKGDTSVKRRTFFKSLASLIHSCRQVVEVTQMLLDHYSFITKVGSEWPAQLFCSLSA